MSDRSKIDCKSVMGMFESKSFNEAIGVFTEAMGDDKAHNVHMLCNIAACEFSLELYRKCIKTCLRVIEQEKENIIVLVLMGKAYLKIGGSSAAIQSWENALNACRSSCNLSMFLEVKNHLEEARKAQPASPSSVPKAVAPPSPSAGGVAVASSSKPAPVTLKDIESYHKKHIGTGPGQISSVFLKQVRSNLSNATGEDLFDDLIAFGYLQVNTGNLDVAIDLFKVLLRFRRDMIAPMLGLGSALALKGVYDEAITYFSKAITSDPSQADSWKRRGQTKLARGFHADAIADFGRAIELGGDADTLTQRGLAFHQTRNFTLAQADLLASVAKGESSITLFNHIGMSEGQLGNCEESLAAYRQAISLDPKFKEALLNYGQMFKEMGDTKNALVNFQRVLDVDPNYLQGYSYRGILHYSMGNVNKAIDDMRVATRQPRRTTTLGLRTLTVTPSLPAA